MNDLQHFGVMGMHWGQRKTYPGTKAITDRANKVLNNPKSTQKELDSALESIGVNPKTGKSQITKPVYDKAGNDISVNPIKRLGRQKGESDKKFDIEFAKETADPTPNDIAKQKVSDLREDKTAKAQTIAMIATAGAIAVVQYVAMNQLKKSADASILAKYGPELANVLFPGRFK